LKQICSGPGKSAQEYKHISSAFDAALDKFGQILKDNKMAAISKQNTLEHRTTMSCEHFTPICLPFYCLSREIYEFVT
jgi:hypothetical protein